MAVRVLWVSGCQTGWVWCSSPRCSSTHLVVIREQSKGAKNFLSVAWGTYDHLFFTSTSEAHGGRWFHIALLRQNFLTLWLLSYMHITCLVVGSICFCYLYYTNWAYTDEEQSGTLAKTTDRRGSNCTELPASPTSRSPKASVLPDRPEREVSPECCPLPGAWVAGSWNSSCRIQETMAKDKLGVEQPAQQHGLWNPTGPFLARRETHYWSQLDEKMALGRIFLMFNIVISLFSVHDGTEWTETQWCTLPEGTVECAWLDKSNKYPGYLDIHVNLMCDGISPDDSIRTQKFVLCEWRDNSASSPTLGQDFWYVVA